jgi:TolB-like protein/Tfp pilus assembly protein PilF
MVGYSALAQRNETLALDLLEEHRRLLRERFGRHNGREIETAGDSFFVEFDSALDAVRCAVDIQKTLHERNTSVPPEESISLRIGIHLGDVVHMGEHVHGDGVNIAARLEPCAEPGGICVSEDVARQLRNQAEIILESIGTPQLKNIALPVSAYRLVLPWKEGARPGSSRTILLLRKKPKRLAAIVATVFLLAFGLYLLVRTSASVADRSSIAVLPFKNPSGDTLIEYLSEGIPEGIIYSLSRLPSLKVMSMNSVLRYKEPDINVQEVGKKLNVKTILVGRIEQHGGSYAISAELVDASDQSHLWGEQYTRHAADIYTLQGELTREISEALQVKLSGEEEKRLTKNYTENSEAYALYNKGRYHWNIRLPDHLTQSVSYFKQAIEKDPSFARAYAGLADAYIIMGDFNMLPPNETYPQAKAAATKAIGIDPELPEAHTSLAYSLMHLWSWERAEQEFQLAIRLDSSYAQAHSWYALYLVARSRFDEASHEAKKALKLEPFSAVIHADVGLVFFAMQEYDSVVEQCTKALELDPMFPAAHMLLGFAYEQKGMYEDAKTKFSGISSVSPGNPLLVAALAHAYASAGEADNANLMLDLLHEKRKEQYVSSYWLAAVYAALGQRSNALKRLEDAYDDRDGLMVFAGVDPRLEVLRKENRFAAILENMGLKRSMSAKKADS